MSHGQNSDQNQMYEKYRLKPETTESVRPILTLKEELMMPSNFILLPDGTWIISGTAIIPDDGNTKLTGLLSSLVAAAMSAKYKISTWNQKLIDFAFESSKNFAVEFNDYQKTLELMLSKRIPRIALGDDCFLLTVKKVFKSSAIRPLRQALLETLIAYHRVLVVCQGFSCLIIKRYNFLYVFTGFPCNVIGYRKFSSGPGCLLRLVELDSLVRRIEFGCNPEGGEVTSFVLVALKVLDITNVSPERYRTEAKSDEDKTVAREIKPIDKQRLQKMKTVRFLDQELCNKDEHVESLNNSKDHGLEERQMECELSSHQTCCAESDLSVPMNCKSSPTSLPIWSRMNRRNAAGKYRNLAITKFKKYDIEIEGRLWSLWGTLHPTAAVFDAASRGKSHLACNVIACCAASVYRLVDWSPQLLDNIVISGDRYHRRSVANIKRTDYEFSLEDLNIECMLEKIRFVLHIEHRAYGKLYCTPTKTCMNLAEAMMYFFSHFQYGVLQCEGRSLGIGYCKGHDGGYFMYDCQSREHPLFPKGQGATYVLRMHHLQVLLYCIVVTLNISYYNAKFTIHQVEMLLKEASMEKSEEEKKD